MIDQEPDFRSLIKKAQIRQNMTFAQLASALGISNATLHRVRAGETKRVSYSVVQSLLALAQEEDVMQVAGYSGLSQLDASLAQDIRKGLRETIEHLIGISAKVELLTMVCRPSGIGDYARLPVDDLADVLDAVHERSLPAEKTPPNAEAERKRQRKSA